MNAKFKAALFLILVFALGVIAGRNWRHPRRHSGHGIGLRTPQPDRAVRRLTKKLHLSQDQQARLRAIFSTANDKTSQLNQEITWELTDIHRETARDIRAILQPSQVAKWEQIHARFHRKTGLPDEDRPGPESIEVQQAKAQIQKARRAYQDAVTRLR